MTYFARLITKHQFCNLLACISLSFLIKFCHWLLGSESISRLNTEDLGSLSFGNYSYYGNGNLKLDNKENLTNIEWTFDGKVKKVYKASGGITSIEYEYDSRGIYLNSMNGTGCNKIRIKSFLSII
jgi:hypothetical protein